MPSFFSFRDAKSLASRYCDIRKKAADVSGVIGRHKAEIVRSAKLLVEFEAQIKLSGISIDEISKRGKGIRIASLRNAGFSSVADVLNVDPQSLTSINGIGQKSAFTISRAASLVAHEVRENTFVALSIDQKNRYSDALICSIYTYLRYREIERSSRNVIPSSLEQEIDGALKSLSIATNPIRWVLSGEEKKEARRGIVLVFG